MEGGFDDIALETAEIHYKSDWRDVEVAADMKILCSEALHNMTQQIARETSVLD